MAVIRGTARDDTLVGTGEADTIFGLGGNDRISGAAGSDLLRGGAGGDVIRDDLGNDRIYGEDGSDPFLSGGRGNDQVFGGAGNDRLDDSSNGPDGNARADGNDFYDGGAGRDSLDFSNQTLGLTLTLADGSGTGRAVQAGEVDTVRNVESVVGTLGDDVIYGNRADNFLSTGGRGNDRVYGRGGDDELVGGDGATQLLDGGSGNDTLNGGFSRASLFGGTGADTLFASSEFAGDPREVDRTDLGRDSARDLFSGFVNTFEGVFSQGLGTERVSHVGAQDRFDLTYGGYGDGEPEILRAADFIDSDRNGVVNDADRDARLVDGNLVVDLDQLFERVDNTQAELGEQHLILEQIARIDADQFI